MSDHLVVDLGNPHTYQAVDLGGLPVTDAEPVVAGPPGPAGPAATPATYPVNAASSWSLSHGRPYPPELRLVDDTGREVIAELDYSDPGVVSIQFPVPFTGTIYLT